MTRDAYEAWMLDREAQAYNGRMRRLEAAREWAVLRDGIPTGDVISAESEDAALKSACELYTPSRVSVVAV